MTSAHKIQREHRRIAFSEYKRRKTDYKNYLDEALGCILRGDHIEAQHPAIAALGAARDTRRFAENINSFPEHLTPAYLFKDMFTAPLKLLLSRHRVKRATEVRNEAEMMFNKAIYRPNK